MDEELRREERRIVSAPYDRAAYLKLRNDYLRAGRDASALDTAIEQNEPVLQDLKAEKKNLYWEQYSQKHIPPSSFRRIARQSFPAAFFTVGAGVGAGVSLCLSTMINFDDGLQLSDAGYGLLTTFSGMVTLGLALATLSYSLFIKDAIEDYRRQSISELHISRLEGRIEQLTEEARNGNLIK